jgi:hypothetical protein
MSTLQVSQGQDSIVATAKVQVTGGVVVADLVTSAAGVISMADVRVSDNSIADIFGFSPNLGVVV